MASPNFQELKDLQTHYWNSLTRFEHEMCNHLIALNLDSAISQFLYDLIESLDLFDNLVLLEDVWTLGFQFIHIGQPLPESVKNSTYYMEGNPIELDLVEDVNGNIRRHCLTIKTNKDHIVTNIKYVDTDW